MKLDIFYMVYYIEHVYVLTCIDNTAKDAEVTASFNVIA